MRRDLLSFLAFAALSQCLTSYSPALAQVHGAGGGAPMSQPTARPNVTDPNSPINTNRAMQIQNADDKTFLRDAAIDSMVEVELAKLAVQRAANDSVKQLGQKDGGRLYKGE